jgi:hypothetical protein
MSRGTRGKPRQQVDYANLEVELHGRYKGPRFILAEEAETHPDPQKSSTEQEDTYEELAG